MTPRAHSLPTLAMNTAASAELRASCSGRLSTSMKPVTAIRPHMLRLCLLLRHALRLLAVARAAAAAVRDALLCRLHRAAYRVSRTLTCRSAAATGRGYPPHSAPDALALALALEDQRALKAAL